MKGWSHSRGSRFTGICVFRKVVPAAGQTVACRNRAQNFDRSPAKSAVTSYRTDTLRASENTVVGLCQLFRQAPHETEEKRWAQPQFSPGNHRGLARVIGGCSARYWLV